MRRAILLIIGMLALVSCSKPGFEQERAQELCNEAAVAPPSSDLMAQLIEQGTFALTDVKERLQSLLDQKSDADFLRAYDQAVTDEAFIAEVELGEKIWLVVLLNRQYLTENNLEAYNKLYDLRRVVDLLNDDVEQRL